MLRLVFNEIKYNPFVWIGSFCIAATTGCLLQWGFALLDTSMASAVEFQKSLYNAGLAVLVTIAFASIIVVGG